MRQNTNVAQKITKGAQKVTKKAVQDKKMPAFFIYIS
jgi:hypothetical protein